MHTQVLITKGVGALKQLAVLLGVWGGLFIVGSMVAAGMLLASGVPMSNPDALLTSGHGALLRWIQAVTTLFIFALPAIVFAFICYRNGWLALGLEKSWHWPIAGLCLLLIAAAGPLSDSLGQINKAIPLSESLRATMDRMEANYETQVKAILDFSSPGGLLLTLVLIALLPALFEELFFRGALQGLLQRWWRSPWAAIIVTSIIFSAIHGSWYGFLPRTALGMVLGAVYYRTGNLWYSIFMHFANNAGAMIYLYVLHRQGKDIALAEATSLPIWAGIPAAAVVVYALYRIFALQPAVRISEVADGSLHPFGPQAPGPAQPHQNG